jgi:hypothetical protein
MRKQLLMVFLFASMIFAQEKVADVKTELPAEQDSVNISDIVQKQIQVALEKQNEVKAYVAPEVLPEKIKIPEPVKIAQTPGQLNLVLSFIQNQPVHVQIFAGISLFIVFFVSFRRIIGSVKRKSLNALKQKITMLREEKVRVKENPKLQTARKQLMGKELIFMKSDKQVSKTAKELNISKGELLLAARLKLLEVGKM